MPFEIFRVGRAGGVVVRERRLPADLIPAEDVAGLGDDKVDVVRLVGVAILVEVPQLEVLQRPAHGLIPAESSGNRGERQTWREGVAEQLRGERLNQQGDNMPGQWPRGRTSQAVGREGGRRERDQHPQLEVFRRAPLGARELDALGLDLRREGVASVIPMPASFIVVILITETRVDTDHAARHR
jgi:hypothetical protein